MVKGNYSKCKGQGQEQEGEEKKKWKGRRLQQSHLVKLMEQRQKKHNMVRNEKK